MSKAHKSDLLLLVINQFIWGVGWSAIKYPQDQMGPFTLNGWTMLISVVVLYPFAYRELAEKPLRNWGNVRALTRRDYLDYFIMGFVGLAGMTLLYNWGTGRSLAANGALISMSVPVLTAVIAVVVLAEKMTIGRLGSLLIAIVGVLIISDVRGANLGLSGGFLFGNSLLLAGAVCNSIYVVYSKRLLTIASPIVLLFWGQVLGFIRFGTIGSAGKLSHPLRARLPLANLDSTRFPGHDLLRHGNGDLFQDSRASGCRTNYGFKLSAAVLRGTDGGFFVARENHFDDGNRRAAGHRRHCPGHV